MNRLTIIRTFLVLTMSLAGMQTVVAQTSFVQAFNSSNGLHDRSVMDIIKDTRGYLWMATSNGVFRFDGYRFVPYVTDEKDMATLSSNFAMCLAESSDGYLWIGTLTAGLNRLSLKTNVMTRLDEKRDSLLGKVINSLATDRDGNVWIGSNGIHKYDAKTGSFKHFFHDASDGTSLKDNSVLKVFVDHQGDVWVGYAGEGFSRYDEKNNRFIHYTNHHPDKTIDYRSNVVRDIGEDLDGNIWLATYGGLLRLVPATRALTHWTVDEKDPDGGLGNNSLWSVTPNKDGRIYIASWGGGVRVYNTQRDEFENELFSNRSLFALPTNALRTLFLENEHKLWVGTNNAGALQVSLVPSMQLIARPDPKAELNFGIFDGDGYYLAFANYGIMITDSLLREKQTIRFGTAKNEIPAVRCNFIHTDGFETFWIATDNGLYRYNKRTRAILAFRNDPEDPKTLSHNYVYTVMKDSRGRIWAGTNWGLDMLSEGQDSFVRLGKLMKESKNVNRILESDSGLWLGTTTTGVMFMDLERNTIRSYGHDPADDSTLSSNFIRGLFADKKHRLWIATQGGLNLLHPKTGKFSHEWKGLGSRADIGFKAMPDREVILEAPDAHYRFKDQAGEVVFEKVKSPVALTLSSIIVGDNLFITSGQTIGVIPYRSLPVFDEIPRVAVTAVGTDLNDEGLLGHEVVNSESLSKGKITLDYQQDLLWFEFSVLDFHHPASSRYMYKLEGFDEDWVHSGARRFVTYTNLSPGHYTFRVRGANAYGNWNEQGAAFGVTVLPPPWRTWWAYTLYAAVLIYLLWLGRRDIIRRERIKTRMALDQQEKETLRELDHLKTNFFSNITHEFRTPLTLIQGPAASLLAQEKNEDARRMIRLIQKNSERLLKLINQLLDLAKLDAHEMKLSIKAVNLEELLTVIIAQFHSLAQSKRIDYRVTLAPGLPTVNCDVEKLEAISSNLLSNAIKFTPEGKNVSIEALYANGTLTLQIIDGGPGIPQDKLTNIFDRFYRIEHEGMVHTEGTGIGLALVKEYTELMKGVIRVESTLGQGTRFEIQLPLAETSIPVMHPRTNNDTVEEKAISAVNEESEDETLPLVLLVEDHGDIRSFIMGCLGKRYRYAEATNGAQGIELAIEHVPDLIISDWMMPGMDGIEMCRRIKSDLRTDHIPFIMLTAKASADSRLEGLRTGADDYLMKPFNSEELVLKVNNQLTLRENMRAHLRRLQFAEPTPAATAESPEEKFLAAARKYIESRLDDESLSVEDLAAELAMSRTQIYRKMIALTGLTPSSFMRKLRLGRAATLLSSGAGNISEVAYQTGYSSLSHFSKAFKEEFGLAPSDYAADRHGK